MNIEEIKKMIAECASVPLESITSDTKLVEDLGMDSLDLMELIMNVEEHYGITLPDDALNDIATVKDIEDQISRL